MSFNKTCTLIHFDAKSGTLSATCSNGERSEINLDSIIGVSKDKRLTWNSSGFLAAVKQSATKTASIYNYGEQGIDLEADVGKWFAPQLRTLSLSRYIAERDNELVFLRDEFLQEEREAASRPTPSVWKGFLTRPEKGPDFLGQSRITGRLR